MFSSKLFLLVSLQEVFWVLTRRRTLIQVTDIDLPTAAGMLPVSPSVSHSTLSHVALIAINSKNAGIAADLVE